MSTPLHRLAVSVALASSVIASQQAQADQSTQVSGRPIDMNWNGPNNTSFQESVLLKAMYRDQFLDDTLANPDLSQMRQVDPKSFQRDTTWDKKGTPWTLGRFTGDDPRFPTAVHMRADGTHWVWAERGSSSQSDSSQLPGNQSGSPSRSDIIKNEHDIENNKRGIANNENDIADNKKNIIKNANGIADNKGDIAKNANGIADNKGDIAKNANGIADNKRDIAKNASGIADNKRDIAKNASGIADNKRDITKNASGIADNKRDITNNASGIADNKRDIAKNASGIADNKRDIAKNAKNLEKTKAQFDERLNALEKKSSEQNTNQAELAKNAPSQPQADDPNDSQGGNGSRPIPRPVESPLRKAYASLSATAKKDARAQLSGAANANLGRATLSGTGQVSNSALAAMRQLGNGMPAAQGNTPGQVSLAGRAQIKPGDSRLWVQALNNASSFDQPQGQKAFGQNTRGVVMGVDWALDDEWRMGLLGGKSLSKHKGDRFEGDLDSWHFGTYAVHQSGPLALRLGAVHSQHYGKTQRNVEFGGYKDRLTGDYGANSQQVFGELGYNLGSGSLSAEPFANLGYQRYSRKGYTEKGGEAALKADAQTQDNFSTTLGLRTASIKYMDNKMSLAPRLSAGWKHMYGAIDSTSTQTHQVTGNTYNTKGIAQDRDSLVVEAGLDLNLSARHSIGVAYNGEVGNNSRTHGLMGQWKMSF